MLDGAMAYLPPLRLPRGCKPRGLPTGEGKGSGGKPPSGAGGRAPSLGSEFNKKNDFQRSDEMPKVKPEKLIKIDAKGICKHCFCPVWNTKERELLTEKYTMRTALL